MPTLVIRHPDGSESEHELSGELKVGRQEGTNDLVLAEGGVSRRHARFFEEDGAVMVEDVGSANGTFVDGQRITGPTALTSRSEVVLGDYALKLKASARPAGARRSTKPAEEGGVALGGSKPESTRAMPAAKRPPAALARRPAPAAPPPEDNADGEKEDEGGFVLKGLTGPWANQKFRLQGKLVVGRQAPATVLLDDDSVSRRHAEVELTPQGPVLRDLGSANGTLLNGERVAANEPMNLQPGDIITFGMVEVAVERTGSAPPRRGRASRAEAASSEEAPAAASRKRLLVVAASVVGVLLVAGIVKSTTGGSEESASGALAAGGAPAVDPTEQIQELLSQCRSYSSSEMGGEPDWGRAESACSKVLNLDPINSEAVSLMKRITLEKDASEQFAQGIKALQRGKDEEALDLFKKIPKESSYFRRAKPKVQEAVSQVMKRSEDDCKRYVRDSQWSAAVPRCERYMGFACQKMSREELEPPIGFTLVLDSRRRLGRTEWRPRNKLYLDFLVARQKLDPNAEPWHCPVSDIFMDDDAAPNPRKIVEAAFKQRFSNKFMHEAMLDYWGGRGNEAVATLQRLRNNYEMAQFHADADKMIADVNNVDQLFKIGQGHLQSEDVEKAAESLQEALDVDKRLMDNLFEARPSFYRRNIQQDMAAKAITRGKYWDERGDGRRACRIWKLGFSFYAGNTDLNSDVGRCSTRALKAFKSAQTCQDLDLVLEYAVPNDGMAEKVAEQKKQSGC
ncbi:FHA domain-containing protein [Cystobacter ferrugineus]|uniref:FHA domain-containing protein n=1 Tax=Cystobacter ferrugineus TaxID=83449 RepID=A0A1L9AYP6_9BACT|nr:FHA domain-containing protein [Cystobacter ferrugineus]OJH35033.1 FHA domain-containing protein [Cystobacter ferrugineus]